MALDEAPAMATMPQPEDGKLEKKQVEEMPSSLSLEHSLPSFREESYIMSDLKESERVALQELKVKVEALLMAPEKSVVDGENTAAAAAEDEGLEKGEATKKNKKSGCCWSLWGVPLVPSMGDRRTNVVLLKFLRARDNKVDDALRMLEATLQWRKAFFGTDAPVADDKNENEKVKEKEKEERENENEKEKDKESKEEEEEEEKGLEERLESVAFMHGVDRHGRPVCYNAFGALQEDPQLYQKSFGDDASLQRFLRWRVQLLEQGIQLLDFNPGVGPHAMVQVTDLRNAPGPARKELRVASKKALNLLQDNYPEMVAKKIFLNVPWYFVALYAMFSPLLTQRTKSKFVVARRGKATETLFKMIAPEHVPVQYGGLSRKNDPDFKSSDKAEEVVIRPGEKHTIEINVKEVDVTILWDLTVVGSCNKATYNAEFVPEEGGCTTIIDKSHTLDLCELPIRNSFEVGKAGKVVITLDNSLSKKKKTMAYRHIVVNKSPKEVGSH